MKTVSSAYIFLFILLSAVTISSECFSQSSNNAGTFARMGYGARGMAMGNAMTAVRGGDTYYNPALSPFVEQRRASATVGFLSLDRYVNFFNYTQAIQPRGGLSVGLINAGVRNIDGRDNDGIHTEDYSTTENQFYLSFANRVDDRVSLGVTVKLYYAKLFDEVASSTVGFDIGAQFQATPELSIGAALIDIGSKYNWNTTSIYSTNGRNTSDKFPMLRKIGAAYTVLNTGVVSADLESASGGGPTIVRFGAEYPVVENFIVRGGVDRVFISGETTGEKPSFGFTVKNSFNDLTPVVTYAFVTEPFAPRGMHILTLSLMF